MDKNRAGIWYGVAAYSLWGIMPVYWKLLAAVPPLEILAHRVAWSFLFAAVIVLFSGGLKDFFATAADKKKLVYMLLSSLIISVNWLTYIYAVNSGQVIEASMGYFMNPLVVILLGVGVLREKLSRWQVIALSLAGLGVLIITAQYGRVPWIAIVLAVSFALYGLVRKISAVDSVSGLTLETLVLVPVALFFIAGLESSGAGEFGKLPIVTKAVLAGTGALTATPLIMFARGVERTTFSMMGFLQYIAPSITLFLGIFVFRENFSLPRLVSFSFIWAALVIFTLANLGVLKESAPAD